jgi:hypothetical protein
VFGDDNSLFPTLNIFSASFREDGHCVLMEEGLERTKDREAAPSYSVIIM